MTVAQITVQADTAVEADLDAQSPAADLVRVYLNGIGRTALLTAQQEVELAKRIEAGVFARHILDTGARLTPSRRADLARLVRDGQRAKDHLLEANLRLVVSLAKRYTGRGMPLLDLIQEGNLGLIRAVEKVADLLEYSRDPVSLDMPVGAEEEAPLGDFIEDAEATDAESAVISGLLHDDLRRVLSTLEDREQKVIRLRYGLDDGQPRTLDQIGKRFGLSRERVRQIEREVMAKLRHGDRAERLRAYAS